MPVSSWKSCIRSFALAASLTAVSAAAHAADKVTVAVTAIVEHPALDAVRDGVHERLKEAGYSDDNLQFIYESAQGQPATAAQIARKFVGMSPNVIVAVSTPSAQAAAAATKDIPIVFSAVTDPVVAGLVKSFKADGSGNITGVSDLSPIAAQVDLFKKIQPALKRIGTVYNPGESNSLVSLELLKQVAKAQGMEVVAAPANRTADVRNAAQTLIGQVDAIYLPPDNTVTAALETVVNVAREAKLPVYANDSASVEKGAIATVGFSYLDIGRQTGDIVVRILKGEKPGAIDSQYAKGTEIVLNKSAAASYGITIPESVLSKATKVLN
ncbi:ABC transporter substrate-binding protein [Mesorhizobium sp. B2-4-17]|uniref:ABC transporter substrate-binding protein n=1 Tax=Mesorhizobium sp. B2-4-17 TaxID=2589932 RepID=UPI0011261CE0|nr:ABC transporter substrate-binding protein [Mesorhizobium sp. B2-4-17]TPK91508.1 ABC transporter substrate-binding protein [Mesorhizobium sp. B2-4-17]